MTDNASNAGSMSSSTSSDSDSPAASATQLTVTEIHKLSETCPRASNSATAPSCAFYRMDFPDAKRKRAAGEQPLRKALSTLRDTPAPRLTKSSARLRFQGSPPLS